MKDTAERVAFHEVTTPLRGELLAYAYRFLGSLDDAEDAVQETLLRAWRAWDRFEHRSSVRTWLYRIATNVCTDASRERQHRPLTPGDEQIEPQADRWVQPFATDRADLRLALVIALQTLPPTQRAVFLLREALQFPASEVAVLLDTSVAAVKSSLQRARRRISTAVPTSEDVVEPRSPVAQRLLTVYIAAFEHGDVDTLLAALRTDAVLELLPDGGRFTGKHACGAVLSAAVGHPGDWRIRPTIANGQPATVVHLHGAPYGVAILEVRGGAIQTITVFADPSLVDRYTIA